MSIPRVIVQCDGRLPLPKASGECKMKICRDTVFMLLKLVVDFSVFVGVFFLPLEMSLVVNDW